jgi:DNA-binding XRE family transcriptional regulator
MSDLQAYITRRRQSDAEYSSGYQSGYEEFKAGLVLKTLRLYGGMTQEEFAKKMHIHTEAVSRMENHAANARLSTLMKAAQLFGKNLYISIED